MVWGSCAERPRPGRLGLQPRRPLPAEFLPSTGPEFRLFQPPGATPGSPGPVSEAVFACKPSVSGSQAPARATAPTLSVDLGEAGAALRWERKGHHSRELNPAGPADSPSQNKAPECLRLGPHGEEVTFGRVYSGTRHHLSRCDRASVPTVGARGGPFLAGTGRRATRSLLPSLGPPAALYSSPCAHLLPSLVPQPHGPSFSCSLPSSRLVGAALPTDLQLTFFLSLPLPEMLSGSWDGYYPPQSVTHDVP